MEAEIWKIILTQGPFAALFVWLLFRSESRNEKREAEQRREMNELRTEIKQERAEWQRERFAWSETLNRFSEKYDLIRDELRDLSEKLRKGMGED